MKSGPVWPFRYHSWGHRHHPRLSLLGPKPLGSGSSSHPPGLPAHLTHTDRFPSLAQPQVSHRRVPKYLVLLNHLIVVQDTITAGTGVSRERLQQRNPWAFMPSHSVHPFQGDLYSGSCCCSAAPAAPRSARAPQPAPESLSFVRWRVSAGSQPLGLWLFPPPRAQPAAAQGPSCTRSVPQHQHNLS